LHSDAHEENVVKPAKDYFPFTIVWCPIPLLTWLLPFIGHLGIVTSDGTIHDFAGPYFVNRHPHKMGFGNVTRYFEVKSQHLKLKTQSEAVKIWDSAINEASAEYDEMLHDLLCNNCHSHVSRALNEVEFFGFTSWNTFLLIFFMFFNGKFVSFARFVQTYIGFVLLLAICLTVLLFS